MSAIFISHSSKDNMIADELKNRLEAQGHRSVFLDFDPNIGIPPGRDWERELYYQLRSCQAIIVLCSKDSMASQWCFAEITHAKALGKQIFPIKIGDCTINTVLTSSQVIDLTINKEEAYQRLWRGLKVAGLDPAHSFDWDGSRPPYPGLMAFHEEDAAIFFGRDVEIQHGLELLNRLRQFGGARMVIVLGSSGSGKSSLVRAGLLPRLRKNKDTWLIIDPFRPREDPLQELAVVLASAFTEHGEARDWRDIHNALKQADVSQPLSGNYLNNLVRDLRILANKKEASVLLVIDQTEELLGLTEGTKEGDFLSLLRAALDTSYSPLMVICTLRSDFLGNFQQQSAAQGLVFEDLRVGPMSVDSLIKIIEGPAEVAGVELEPGLVQAMVKDTETDYALPLLAFTLRELYERYGDDRRLTIEEYRDKLGGLSGSVAKAAETVFKAKSLTKDEQADFRKSFLLMVRINEEGRFVRRIARWTELPERIHPLLERFVQGRLLVSSGEGHDRTLEVAHETLFHSWNLLRIWLDEDREFLLWRKRLDERVVEWQNRSQDEGSFLRGASLVEAESWIRKRFDDLGLDERTYIQKSLELHEKEKEKSEHQKDVALKAFYKLTYEVPEMLAKFPGTAEMRKKFVTDTLQPLEDLVKLNARASEFLRELATNYRLLGTILIELNELKEARKALQKSAEYCSELILQNPNEAFYHRDLAVSHYNIGIILERQGKLAGAHKEYMAAYEPAKRAAELDPSRWKEFFADVQSRISLSVR